LRECGACKGKAQYEADDFFHNQIVDGAVCLLYYMIVNKLGQSSQKKTYYW